MCAQHPSKKPGQKKGRRTVLAERNVEAQKVTLGGGKSGGEETAGGWETTLLTRANQQKAT